MPTAAWADDALLFWKSRTPYYDILSDLIRYRLASRFPGSVGIHRVLKSKACTFFTTDLNYDQQQTYEPCASQTELLYCTFTGPRSYSWGICMLVLCRVRHIGGKFWKFGLRVAWGYGLLEFRKKLIKPFCNYRPNPQQNATAAMKCGDYLRENYGVLLIFSPQRWQRVCVVVLNRPLIMNINEHIQEVHVIVAEKTDY